MLTLLYLLALTTPQPAADPCAELLADAPGLEGLAVEMAVECSRERAAVALAGRQVEGAGLWMPRPEWVFAEPRTPVELDAELAIVGTQVSPFAVDGGANPFAVDGGR